MTDEKDPLVSKDKMDRMSVAPADPKEAKDKDRKEERRQQEELEEGLEETFPASDPPANTQPGHGDPVPSSGSPEETKKRD